MADQKDPKERNTASQKSLGKERITSSRAQLEQKETSFDGAGPNLRERVTGSQVVARPAAPPERERVTQKVEAQRPRTTASTPAMGGKPGRPGMAAPPPGAVTQPKAMTTHQKQMLSSAFQDAARMNALKSVVGNTGEAPREDEADEPTAQGTPFDGKTPAPGLDSRDLFKAVLAPVQSREGRRSKSLFQQVLQQFAIGHNPRYAPDAQGPKGHIFVWDVSRAMSCEVPHFVGTKELSLGQTCDWLRHEGPGRGWRRATPQDAVGAANAGQLVLIMPREPRVKQLGVVIAAPADAEGRPRIAAAGQKVGGSLSVLEALGVWAAEYFVHS